MGKLSRREHDRDRAGQHQRDQRQVQAAHTQRRQADQCPEHHRDDPGRSAARAGTAARSRTGRLAATQAPIASTAAWPSETSPTHPQARRARARRSCRSRPGSGVDVVGAEDRREREQHEQQQQPDVTAGRCKRTGLDPLRPRPRLRRRVPALPRRSRPRLWPDDARPADRMTVLAVRITSSAIAASTNGVMSG